MKSSLFAGALAAVLALSSLAFAEESTTLVPAEVLSQQVDQMDAAVGFNPAFARVFFRCEARNRAGQPFFADGRIPEQAQRRAIGVCVRHSRPIGGCHPAGCRGI